MEPTVSVKYPSFRDDSAVKSVHLWLAGKRADDNAGGLWRIHDKLYDLTDFMDRHPGGKFWIESTKGTDITEPFETHHLHSKAEKLLPKYYVKEAAAPRNYKITFNEDGFYMRLKGKVKDRLKSLDNRPAFYSKIINDLLVVSTFITAILSAKNDSYFWAIISGILLNFATISAHNFFHRKDNFRMYYFNLSLFNANDWRVSHALSHHLYTNTFHDMEISMFEPFLVWIPRSKSFVERYVSWLYTPLVYLTLFHQAFVGRVIWHFTSDKEHLGLDDLVGFSVPLAMFLFGQPNLYSVIFLWTLIIFTASFSFSVIGLNAGHHHPDNAHEGDELCKSMDFGIFQMDAVIDRIDLKGNQFLVLTHFGEHTLHHMFPTMDHGLLPQLNDLFLETCQEFETELREYPFYKLIQGQFQQLARTEPRSLEEKGRKKFL